MTPIPSLRRPDGWLGHAIRADLRGRFWRTLWLRVSQAGGWYPVIVMTAWWLLTAVSTLRLASVVTSLLTMLLFGIVPYCLGFLYAAIVAAFALPAIWLALKALGRSARPDRIGMFAGGCVAFLCTLPVQIELFQDRLFGGASLAVAILGWMMIPSVAIFIGQVGGALAAPNTLRARRLGPTGRRFELMLPRFGVAQLLGLMIVCSVTLTLLRLAGLLTAPVLIAGCVWAAFQAACTSPAAWVANRLLTQSRLRHRRWRRRPSGRLRIALAQHRTRTRST